MPVPPHGLHHYQKRKKIHESKQEAQENRKIKKLIDRSIYFVGMLGPLMTTPQILKIWYEQSATGLSVITWSAYAMVNAFWILYGIVHKERPIVLIHLASFMTLSIVVIGIFLYR